MMYCRNSSHTVQYVLIGQTVSTCRRMLLTTSTTENTKYAIT